MLPSPYDWLIPIVIAPFIGSFLGVLAVRLPAGEDVVTARSRCRHCGHKLRPWELVPVASWIALAGRCSACRAPIGSFHPAMELGALLVAVWAAVVTEGAPLWATIALGWALLALGAMDVRSLILADVVTLPLTAAGLLVIAVVNSPQIWLHAAGAMAGFALMIAVAFAYRKLRGREGLGFGDAKLMAAAGAWTGLEGLGSVLLYAVASGIAIATLMRMRGETVGAASEIPFGAGIALGLWLVWLYGPLVLAA